MDDSLGALAHRAQRGDEEAFRRLVEACHARIYRWALMHTADRDDAEDVVQSVLVRLWQRLDTYAGRAHFTTWLFRVTRNVALGLRRSRGRAERRAEAWTAQTHRGRPAPGPDEEVESRDTMELLTAMVEELPERQRVIFDLADLQGYAQSDVAELLGMNPATVRAHLFKARRTLRRRLLETAPELAEGRLP